MKKPRNQFAALPEQDRQLILSLCSRHPYEHVVDLLEKPRPEGGLGIATSRSALSRFFTCWHAEPARIVLSQYASAAQVQHEKDSNAFLGAIRASVEARVLENLRTGKALADMEKDFRLLKTTQSLYLADAQWRAKNQKAARAAYHHYVNDCANAPNNDFIPVEELANDGSPQSSAEMDLLELTEFQQDIIKAKLEQKRQDEQHEHLLATLKAAGIGPKNLPTEDGFHQKEPVIPYFPPNPTSVKSPVPTAAESGLDQPSLTPNNTGSEGVNAVKPRPHVRPDPKIRRNDSCPCGSGKKYKKCCLLNKPVSLERVQSASQNSADVSGEDS